MFLKDCFVPDSEQTVRRDVAVGLDQFPLLFNLSVDACNWPDELLSDKLIVCSHGRVWEILLFVNHCFHAKWPKSSWIQNDRIVYVDANR